MFNLEDTYEIVESLVNVVCSHSTSLDRSSTEHLTMALAEQWLVQNYRAYEEAIQSDD